MNAFGASAVYPLRRWPEEAFEQEPAHGFFVRLAQRNGAHSTRVFADSFGLNGRDFDLRELLSFCQAFPVRNIDRVAAATPRCGGSFIHLNGQKFRKRTDWSLLHPRVCGACLGESRYYRNWWDLIVIGRCPIHDQPLINGSPSSNLAWWYPAIGVTPEGHDLAIAAPGHNQTIRPSWDAYLLGRIGILPPVSVPLLDCCELYEVITAAELLGKAALFGFGRKAPGRLKDVIRYHALSAGFSAFREGNQGVVALIEEYARSPTSGIHNRNHNASLESFFGWLIKAEKCLRPSIARTHISEAMRLIAGAHGIGCRRGRKSSYASQVSPTALKPLAKHLGIPKKRLLAIAKKIGLLRKRTGRGIYHSFGSEDISLIRSTLADLICLRDAIHLTGLSAKKFKQFCKAKGIGAFAYPGTAQALFRRTEIEKCISASCDAGDGSLQSPSLYRRRRPPTIQGLSLSVAASILGVRPVVVSALIADGYLNLVDLSQASAGTAGVEETQFLAFSTRYARASLYFEGNAQTSSRCIDQLRKLGVERIPLSFTGTSFVERQEVRKALGLTLDPDDRRVCPAAEFWNQMRVWIKQAQSPTLVYPDYGADSAKLWSGDFRTRALVILEPTISRVRIEFHSTSGSRRGRLFRDHLERIRREWSNSEIFEGHDSYCATDSHYGLSLTATDNWPELFRWIELRMKLLRSVFSRGAECSSAVVSRAKSPRVSQFAA
ncbi:MAG: TniQ family protein [Alphaproteobacteria bacterium]|uniref:TniQ family protein n=1 Tax=Bradyrhizobium sp. TaxID=376 RepID=UPI001EC872B4|nr:TniQ family protein [Bradyrhizobium sp.]MBV9570791.1 TniQ family protein [Alphaproteobacteria bacterium]MBV9979042.1 TniQ family protein [Bradyrhizobium sp.]